MSTITRVEPADLPAPVDRRPATRRPAPARTRVLVVEHDEAYRRALHAALTKEGFDVDIAVDVLEGLRRFTADPPDVVLLEVLLPGVSGAEVCRRMRAVADVPVIMVTAAGTSFDVVRALQLGASDYLTKPYRLRELVARIDAVRRPIVAEQTTPSATMGATSRRDDMAIGALRVDFARRQVHRDGCEVHLPRREFDLLAILLTPAGQLHSRAELLGRLWSGRSPQGSRTLDTHIRRLRLKLESDPRRPRHLITVRGIGYRFDIDLLEEAPARP